MNLTWHVYRPDKHFVSLTNEVYLFNFKRTSLSVLKYRDLIFLHVKRRKQNKKFLYELKLINTFAVTYSGDLFSRCDGRNVYLRCVWVTWRENLWIFIVHDEDRGLFCNWHNTYRAWQTNYLEYVSLIWTICGHDTQFLESVLWRDTYMVTAICLEFMNLSRREYGHDKYF